MPASIRTPKKREISNLIPVSGFSQARLVQLEIELSTLTREERRHAQG